MYGKIQESKGNTEHPLRPVVFRAEQVLWGEGY